MMKLMTLKQHMKMSKPALIRKITMTLRAMPKVKLARLCYNITKAKLPRLKQKRQLEWVHAKAHRKGMKALDLTSQEMLDFYEEEPKWYSKRLSADELRFKKREIAKYKRKTKRKFSRKQLAAQRLFAKRARAGTLRRR